MPENGPSGSMSGEWKRSISHRATPRLYCVEEALTVLGTLFGGATAFPKGRGI